MAHVQIAGHQHLLHRWRQVEQAQQVARRAARPADGLRSLFVSQRELLHQSLQALGFFQRVQVLALDVLDQRHHRCRFVRDLLDEHRYFVQAGQLGGAETPLAGDDLVLVR